MQFKRMTIVALAFAALYLPTASADEASVDLKLNRAEELFQAGRYEDAINAASQALKLRPDDSRGLYVRAMARTSLGDAEGALADIKSGYDDEHAELWDEAQMAAEDMRSVQRAYSPEGVAELEQNLGIINAAIEAHLHRTCGYYRVYGDDGDKIEADVRTYADCVMHWSRTGKAIAGSFGPDVMQAVGRINEFKVWRADDLLCSKMPKKAKCVSDALHVRAQAAVTTNPIHKIGYGEYDRLSQEIRSHNASVSRTNAMIKTASFLQSLANALAAQ